MRSGTPKSSVNALFDWSLGDPRRFVSAIPRPHVMLPTSGLALAILATVATCAHAADYSVAPNAKASVRIEDNILGTAFRPQSAWGFDVSSSVDITAQTEVSNSQLFPRVNLRRFIVGDSFNADEYGVAFNNYLVGERYKAGVSFDYGRDSTLTTENIDTVRVNRATNRDSITVQPSINYLLTDRVALQGGFLYNTVAYADAAASGFVDYQYKQANIGVTYQWRPDAEVFASMYRSEFEGDSADSLTTTYSGQAGMTWHWSETLSTTGAIGWVSSDISFSELRQVLVADPLPRLVVVEVPVQGSSSGPIASATIEKRFLASTAKLDYARRISPTGRGAQSSSDHIELLAMRKLSERWRIQFNGIYDMQTAEVVGLGGIFSSGILDRDYLALVGSMRYRIAREWTLSGIYRFSNRKSTNFGASTQADAHALFFAVEFNGDPIKF